MVVDAIPIHLDRIGQRLPTFTGLLDANNTILDKLDHGNVDGIVRDGIKEQEKIMKAIQLERQEVGKWMTKLRRFLANRSKADESAGQKSNLTNHHDEDFYEGMIWENYVPQP
uniref:Uncharacterized protein n=1 Tax=Romanomermis culicivorax TaxID=13658 RepID=A0A915L6L6_ROMCU